MKSGGKKTKQIQEAAAPKSVGPSAFKILFSEMLGEVANGDWSLVSKDYKKPLKCYVKEAYPYFLVTDGYFFVQAYFTKEAVAEYRSKFGDRIRITGL